MSTMLHRLSLFLAKYLSAGSSSETRPMPIIVGSPRSGTTLLRFMLDAHPELAIPPETGFLRLADAWLKSGDVAERVFQDITTFPVEAPGWRDFHLSTESYRREIEKLEKRNAAEGVRLFYRMYASRFDKPRWGEKTPLYCRCMASIERLLPEAHFIHIVRDGRDVALSLRSRFFSPGHDVETQAGYWRENVESARQAGSRCRHYLEVRYEDLLQDTEAILRKICAFIDLTFTRDMLLYYQRTPERLREHLSRYQVTGRLLISHEERLRQQAATMRAPDVSRIGAWRHEMSSDEIHRFQAVAGTLLEELGYSLAQDCRRASQDASTPVCPNSR